MAKAIVKASSVMALRRGRGGPLVPLYQGVEPYGDEPRHRRPKSLWGAIGELSRAELEYLAVHVFGTRKRDWNLLMAEGILMYALETNRIERGPRGGWLVWVDEAGIVKLRVSA